jgi:crotonobetainyl-CoA:carnitine CoA-transferase CaiB-like acyl-CoA transferase
VVDLSTWLAGAYAPTILAELGARVLAVEPLGGEPGRYLIGGLLAFATSQGKESIAVDLKRPEARAIVHQLVAKSDIVYHNYRPGVAERLGVDYAACRKLNPRVVYLNASAYGDSGPDQGRPSFAGTIAAMNGYAARQAGTGHPPPGDSQRLGMETLKLEAWRLARTVDGRTDVNAALAAVTAVLLGLHARERSGVGQELMTTMLCSNVHANSDELIDYEGRPPIRRADPDLFGMSPLYRLYEASDGWLFLACVSRREWDAFCRAVGRLDLQPAWETGWSDTAVSAEGQALADTIAGVLRRDSAAAWEQLASEHDVPMVAVESRDPGQLSVEEEGLRAQGLMVNVHSPTYGDYWRHGALHQFSADQPTFGPWEPVGGHTRPILAELGYSDQEIDRLVGERVVEDAHEG